MLRSSEWSGPRSPFKLLDIWQSFADSLNHGYQMSIYEYDNDLSVRDAIDLILKTENLKQYPEYESFQSSVEDIDRKFKSMLSDKQFRTDKTLWWQRGILMNRSGEYAADVTELYRIEE